MGTTNNDKILIHWRTRDREAIKLIRQRFNIPTYTTVNGWTPAVLPRGKDKELFDETARRGFFGYVCAEWSMVEGVCKW